MSLTPAQKRRRDFKTPDDWARWAVSVVRGGGGYIEVNEYSWRSGTFDLLRGLRYARKRGLVQCLRSKPERSVYVLVEKGGAA